MVNPALLQSIAREWSRNVDHAWEKAIWLTAGRMSRSAKNLSSLERLPKKIRSIECFLPNAIYVVEGQGEPSQRHGHHGQSLPHCPRSSIRMRYVSRPSGADTAKSGADQSKIRVSRTPTRQPEPTTGPSIWGALQCCFATSVYHGG